MQNLLNPQNSLDLEHFMLLAELNISQKKFNVALVFYECALYICTDILNHIDNVINSIGTNSNHNRNHIDTLMQRYVLIKLYVNCKLANIFLQHTDTTIYSIDYLIECINKTVSHIDMDSDLLIYGFYASMTLSEFYIIENKYGEASDCILLIYNLPNVNIPEIKMILTSKLYKISYLTQNVDNCCYWISNGVKFAKTLESNDIILNYFYLLSIMTTIIFYSTNILDKLIDDFSNGSYLEFTPCFINSQDYSLIIFHYLIKAIHIYYKGNMTKLGKILTILYSALANFRNSKHRNQYISWMTLPEIYSNVSLITTCYCLLKGNPKNAIRMIQDTFKFSKKISKCCCIPLRVHLQLVCVENRFLTNLHYGNVKEAIKMLHAMRSLLFDANEINAESTNYSKFCFFIPHFFINKAIFLMYLNKYLEAGNQLVEALKIFEFGRIRQYIRLFIALVHLRMQKYDEFRIVLNRMLQDKNKSENSMIVYCSACLLASEAIISINEFSESKKYLREVIVFTKKEKILPLLASAYYFVIHTGFRLGNFTPGYKLISDFDVIINSLKCPTLDLLSSFLWNKYWVNEGNEYEIRKSLNKYCEIYQLFIENRQMAITEIGDIFNIQNINN